jgi:hypothetical protein
MWELISDTWELISDTWELISDKWEVICDVRINKWYWELISDIWELVSDTWALISEQWEVISDMWELISDMFPVLREPWVCTQRSQKQKLACISVTWMSFCLRLFNFYAGSIRLLPLIYLHHNVYPLLLKSWTTAQIFLWITFSNTK